MSLNLLGLGFVFGAVDDGLTSFQQKALKGFNSLTDSLDQMNAMASNFNSTGLNLTTGLEAQRIQFDKSAKEIIAQAGYSGDALNRMSQAATSLSENLGISVQASSKAQVAYARQGSVFDALNMKTSDLAKLQEAYGVDVIKLTAYVRELTKVHGLSSESAAEYVNKIFGMGQAMKDVPGAFDAAFSSGSDLMRLMATGGPEVETYMDGILRSQKILFDFGLSSDRARSATSALTKKIVENKEGFNKLVSGIAKDIPSTMKSLSILNQDFLKAFDNMSEGPDKLLMGVFEMVRGYRAERKRLGGETDKTKAIFGGIKNFVTAHLGKALGEDAIDPLLASLRNMTDVSDEEFSKLVSNATVAAGDMSKNVKKAWRTSLSPQQQIELAEDQFVAFFRGLTGSSYKFVRDTRKNFREFRKELSDLAKDEGPLGDLTRGLSKAHKLGAMAFVPDNFKKTAQMIGLMGKTLTPVLESFKNFGVSGLNLMSGINLAIMGGVGLWLKYQQAMRDIKNEAFSYADAQKEAIDRVAKDVTDWIFNTTDKISNFIENDLPAVIQTVETIWDKVSPHLEAASNKFWDKYGGKMEKWLGDAWDRASTFFLVQWDDFWVKNGPRLEQGFRSLVYKMGSILKTVFVDELIMAITHVWRKFKKGLYDLFIDVIANIALGPLGKKLFGEGMVDKLKDMYQPNDPYAQRNAERQRQADIQESTRLKRSNERAINLAKARSDNAYAGANAQAQNAAVLQYLDRLDSALTGSQLVLVRPETGQTLVEDGQGAPPVYNVPAVSPAGVPIPAKGK